MIFVTIGTQEPFDRLIKAMDELAPYLKGIEIVAQVSQTKYEIQHMKTHSFLDPAEFSQLFSRASLIVAHAGMGTIISALQCNKPIVILPRQASLGEHRNEHQMATAKVLDKMKYIHVAYDEMQLKNKVMTFYKGEMHPLHSIGDDASPELISSIQAYLQLDHPKRA